MIARAAVGAEERRNEEQQSVASLVAAFEAQGIDHRAALKKAARALGLTRDAAYRRLMAERSIEES
jgi:hypothetical protein